MTGIICPLLNVQTLPFWNDTDVDAEQTIVQMVDIELPDDDLVQCGSEFCVIVTNWLWNSIVEMWTVKTGLRLRLRLGLRLVMTVQILTV